MARLIGVIINSVYLSGLNTQTCTVQTCFLMVSVLGITEPGSPHKSAFVPDLDVTVTRKTEIIILALTVILLELNHLVKL